MVQGRHVRGMHHASHHLSKDLKRIQEDCRRSIPGWQYQMRILDIHGTLIDDLMSKAKETVRGDKKSS